MQPCCDNHFSKGKGNMNGKPNDSAAIRHASSDLIKSKKEHLDPRAPNLCLSQHRKHTTFQKVLNSICLYILVEAKFWYTLIIFVILDI
eukprot:UN28315